MPAPQRPGTPAPASPPARRDVRLRRARRGRMLGGVCAGLARELGIDPLIVRLAFVAAAAAGGAGVVVYVLAWVLLGDDKGGRGVAMRLPRTGRAGLEVAGGIGLLLLALLLGLRQLGVPFSDVIVWPTVLIAAGGALLWRGSAVSPERRDEGEKAEEVSSSQVLSRTGLGVVLVVLAMLAFLQASGALGAARDVLLAIVAVTVALGVIFAPYTVRLARSLAAERSERIRSQERAEMAAHLHDSVLQTLALVQRRADDPAEVAALARRQERELRAWLGGRTATPGAAPTLAAALDTAAAEVETDHGVPVEVVAVGDAELDERGLALVAAAREAMVNAAKFAGGGPIDVYAEADEGRLQVFVRDRGPGFDPAAVPEDRRGVRESIVARMARHGGSARITAAPGAGTEVELVLEP
jgi:signal transduction histidine kinase/phage shock protein PspC (stress-responsive transcriptional regulator)